ncbi:hypothetical protein [Streptomyces sp. HC307]|uniref:hypothetical protein n=1 Tax=Streptomyces flavusporus TaxID=3385496 RepID=UPI003916D460
MKPWEWTMPAPERIRPRIRARMKDASIGLLLIACCACTADQKEPQASKPTTVPKITTATRMTLPIESYMFTDAQRQRIVAAKEQVITDCMKRFGFTYEAPAPESSFQPESMTALRYGVTSVSDATRFGYRPKGSEEVAAAEATRAPTTKTFKKILQGTGKPFAYKSKSVPKDGCVGEARRALHDTEKDGGGGDAEISNGINAASWDYSYKSKEVRAVFKEWSACMKQEDYRYTDPIAANNDPEWKQSTSATEAEKRVATADAKCKKEYNVVGTWYASDKTYQQKMIAENLKQLEPVQRKISAQVRLAGEILGN